MKILLVEDDRSIAETLVEQLRGERFDVLWVTTGADALISTAEVGLILLDLGLPDMEGLDVCRDLRKLTSAPIIMLTARDSETDRVVGLELGADDYIGKPFGFRELVARIRAVRRRAADGGAQHESVVLQAGPLRIDTRTRLVTMDQTPIDLTPREYDLLVCLARDAGAVLSRERILEEVWDINWFGPTKTLDVHVGSLRRKLGSAEIIETIRGVGFRLVVR